jgi:hypothetical protein
LTHLFIGGSWGGGIKNSRDSFGAVFNKTNEGSHDQGTKHDLATDLKGRYHVGGAPKKDVSIH